MDLKKVGILEKDNFSYEAIERLSKFYDVYFYDANKSLKSFIEDKYALFVRLAHQIDDELITNATSLRYICSPTTGLNHISVSSPDIGIVSLKGEYEFLSTIRATPEHIMGLTFSLLRNYKFAFRSTENVEWNRDTYRGYEIYNRDIGIIGYGRIGKLLCGFFQAFGAKLHVYEIDKERCSGVCGHSVVFHNSIEELIQTSSIVILCVNYEPQNKEMISKKHFDLLNGKYFINASRGELVNENDFLNFIENGDFLGVAADVFANETGSMDTYQKMLELAIDKNVIITPHIGGATYTSMHRTEEFIVDKLLRIDGYTNIL